MGIFSIFSSILGGNSQKKAAQQAQQAQVDAYNRGIELQNAQYQQTRQDYMPYTQAGTAAIGGLSDLLGLPGPVTGFGGGTFNIDGSQATPTDRQGAAIAALRQGPLYQSLFNNGREALLQNGAATGGLRGGNFERASMDFGADVLANVYQNQLQNLSGLSSLGLGATGQVGQFGANAANVNTGLLGDIGNAQAANYLTRGGINAKNWSNIGGFLDNAAGAGLGGGGGGFSLSKALSSIF